MSARVLMIADRDFATREHDLLERIEHGVRDAGHHVARAVPSGVKIWETGAPSAVIAYDDSSGFLRPFTVPETILDALQTEREDDVFAGGTQVDLVHAWGAGSYRAAVEIAAACDAGLVLDYSSEFATPKLRKLNRSISGLGGESAPRVCVVAADESLADRARSFLADSDVRTLSWGVPEVVSTTSRDAHAPLSVSVMCTGRSRRDVIHALNAISEVRATHPEMIVFLDEQALDSNASIHRHVESIGLEDCLSVIGNMESARELILETDVLVAPDLRHEHRSLVLEAVARGMGVVVREGSFLSEDVPEDAPFILSRPDCACVREAILACIVDEDRVRERCARATSYIRKDHDASRHLSGIIDAYESVIGAPPVPIGTR